MSVIHHPNVVTDGLVYCIDAANKACYSGSGTTGVDLVKGGTTTLVNQVTFSSDKAGVFAFDGTNDYIEQDWSFTLGTGDLTIEFWVKMDWIISPQGANVFLSVTDPDVHEQLQFGLEDSTAQRFAVYLQGGSNGTKTGDEVYSWSTDQWYHLVASRISSTVALYRDGVSLTVATGATNTGDVAAISAFLLGNQYKGGELKHDFQGDMGPIRIYNKGLTAAEVLQNYEAMKPRLAPRITKSGLVGNWDAGDPQSYNGGTTWKDTANHNSVTLENNSTGFDFNSANGGFLEFDGTDDYCSGGPVPPSGDSTYGAWCYFDSTGASWKPVFNSSDNTLYLWLGRNSGGSLYLHHHNTNNNTSHYTSTVSTLSLSTWYYITSTWDGSAITLYINGASQSATTSGTPTNITNASGIWFGQYGGDYFGGRMSVLQIYNKALSAAEVMDNYQKTKARFGH